VWRLMSYIKNTKEYYDRFEKEFTIPEGFLEDMPKITFVDQSKDFEDDDCGDSCKI
jgi:hypothetical protein